MSLGLAQIATVGFFAVSRQKLARYCKSYRIRASNGIFVDVLGFDMKGFGFGVV